jgi:hypothetical protein
MRVTFALDGDRELIRQFIASGLILSQQDAFSPIGPKGQALLVDEILASAEPSKARLTIKLGKFKGVSAPVPN